MVIGQIDMDNASVPATNPFEKTERASPDTLKLTEATGADMPGEGKAADWTHPRLRELATPALVIDAATVRHNLERLANYAAQHGLGVRPHTKTHKRRTLARLQLQAGALGLTVAKVGEAEQMMEIGEDILMAYPAVDPDRCRRLADIARSKTLRVAMDTRQAVEALAAAAGAAGSTIGLLVEIDVGMRRTGVASGEASLQLAQFIAGTKGVRLDGLMCYPGHILTPPDRQSPLLAAVEARLEEALALWARHGLAARIVSGGSTPTAYQSHLVKAYTEIRPGTYVFNDMNTVRRGCCALEDCAARLLCTVVSDAVKDQVVLDGGSKTFTTEGCPPAPESGHGFIVEYPEAILTRLSEEHGQVDVTRCGTRPKVGERVTVIPNHICPCVNLQDALWWLEPDGTVQRIQVDARGKLS
jgi:D-serine deaminase-like pyridoxal phosphate-dependent protein